MRTSKHDNKKHQRDGREALREKARLLVLRGDYFRAREIIDALIESDPRDMRAQGLLRQIDAAEQGTGKAASWRAQARRHRGDWQRQIAAWIRRCGQRIVMWARRVSEWRSRTVRGAQYCRRWLASGQWRELELRRRFVSLCRRCWKWLTGRPWRRVDWGGGIVRWLAERERPTKWELVSTGIVGMIVSIDLFRLLQVVSQFGWSFQVLVLGKNSSSLQPVWFQVLCHVIPLVLVLLFWTQGLLRQYRPRPE